jgi:hypothetical protein
MVSEIEPLRAQHGVFRYTWPVSFSSIAVTQRIPTMRLFALSVLCALSANTVAANPPKAKVFAEVEVKLASTLEKQSAGVRTLFITLYDDAAKGPMPYGAMKVDLAADAKGTVYKGVLDDASVMIMGGGAEPKKFRIKVKLDKDGSAGPDSPGDLVGNATGVTVGSKTTITIDKAI